MCEACFPDFAFYVSSQLLWLKFWTLSIVLGQKNPQGFGIWVCLSVFKCKGEIGKPTLVGLLERASLCPWTETDCL